jgi:hypothetical protein
MSGNDLKKGQKNMKSMSRRDFMKGLAIAASASVIPTFANRSTRPNVIILFIDDLAYGELGAFGCPDIPTPHMDSLAANGVKCTNSYITNPPCSPSRCCRHGTRSAHPQ